MYNYNKVPLSLVSATLLSTILVACGGSKNESNVTSVASNEPIQITQSSWKKSQQKTLQNITIKSSIKRITRFSPNYLVEIDVESNTDINDIKHWQIHLDTDNNTKTGFQFTGSGWSGESGIDFIIEDGYLYKSTADDSSWGWELVRDKPVTVDYLGGLNIKFTPEIFADKRVCKKYKIGFIEFDNDWRIEQFHPKANRLLERFTSYCNTNTPPVITLIGASTINLTEGEMFIDPGATATDKEDGDLTAKIFRAYKLNGISIPKIDTNKAGHYTIDYSIRDSKGVTKLITRHLNIIKQVSGKVIDGEDDDWTNPNPYLRNDAGIWIEDDSKNIYLIVKEGISGLGEHTQIFIDSDNNIDTGYVIHNDGSTLISGGRPVDKWAGADIMIEDGNSFRFTGTDNSWEWSWNKAINNINIVRKNGNIELAIPKSNFNNNTVSIGFMSLDEDWNKRFGLVILKY